MRRLLIPLALGLALAGLTGCAKPKDKQPSWNGAPTTNTPPPTGKAGEAAENMPVPKDKQTTTTSNEGGAAPK